MKNKTIYIFRHGETRVSKYGGFYLNYFSAQLLPEAKKPLERMGKYIQKLPQGKHFMSPMTRCQQTVEIVTNGTQRKFFIDTRLQEYGRELPWTFVKRVKSFLSDVNKLPDEHIYICTHGVVITALVNLLAFNKFGAKELMESVIRPIKPAVFVTIKGTEIQTISFRNKN